MGSLLVSCFSLWTDPLLKNYLSPVNAHTDKHTHIPNWHFSEQRCQCMAGRQVLWHNPQRSYLITDRPRPFIFFPLPSAQDTGKGKAGEPNPPNPPKSPVRGGSCDWLAPRMVCCPQWAGRSGPFLYHWPVQRERRREGERGKGSKCWDVRKRERG